MLAEKFFLLLEQIRSRTYPDGAPRIVSSKSPHVPFKLLGGDSLSADHTARVNTAEPRLSSSG
jgi:hypothetical protein